MLLACASAASAAKLPADLIVQTTTGKVQGAYFEDPKYPVATWKGIPYASPPLGDLRFAPPQPAAAWTGVLQATQYSAGCMQFCHLDVPQFSCPPVTSEDCLYLNVYTPTSAPPPGGFPVMFWVHGGNFIMGAGGVTFYHGAYLASSQGVVVVTVNYRLGAFGALYTQKGTIEGNFHLQDQRLAMKWVQANIAAFAGNPGNVTLFGQSAGGASAAAHLASPLSWGLFHRVAVHSDPYSLPCGTAATAVQLAGRLLAALGCPGVDDPAHVACLRSAQAMDILHAQNATNFSPWPWDIMLLFMPWTPTVTGTAELPMEPLDAALSGQIARVPLVMGTVLHEGRIFIFRASKNPTSVFEYEALIVALFGPIGAEEIFTQYGSVPAANRSDTRGWISKLTTDYVFQCPTRAVAAALTAAGLPVYLYEFPHVLSGSDFVFGDLYPECIGYSCHGSELVPLWHTGPLMKGAPPMTAGEEVLSAAMQAAWGAFARTGVPVLNGGAWPQYTPTTSPAANFSVPANGGAHVTYGYQAAFCDMFDRLSYHHGGPSALRKKVAAAVGQMVGHQ